jgi:hypothetical protein
MTGGFACCLDDLVERTEAICLHLHGLLDTLQNVSEPTWDHEHAWGNLGVDVDSDDFITTVQTITSNLTTSSELIAVVSQIIEASPWVSRICVEEFSEELPERVFDFPMTVVENPDSEVHTEPYLPPFAPPEFAPQRSPRRMAEIREKRKDHQAEEKRKRDVKAARQAQARILRTTRDDDSDGDDGDDIHERSHVKANERARIEASRVPIILPDPNEGSLEEEDEEEKEETSRVSAPTVLDEISDNSKRTGDMIHGRRWTRHAKDIMFVLYASSPKAYSLLSELMAVPSVSQLYKVFRPLLEEIELSLQNTDQIPSIVHSWRAKEKLADDLVIDVILGVDAASFAPTELPGHDRPVRYSYLFHVMPTNPEWTSFTIHLYPHASPSLGQKGYDLYNKIANSLLNQKVKVLTYATDGDRGNLLAQKKIFDSYREYLDEEMEVICDRVFPSMEGPWWIADTLHVLKCQRSRLENDLFLDPDFSPINAETMNESLDLGAPLTNFRGLTKMNDVLAVEVFTMDNLVTLVYNYNMLEAYYLLPFVCWYSAISIQDLAWETRLNLIRCAFYVFVDWYHRAMRLREFLKDKKFFVEIPDIPRYLNTLLFLFQLTRMKKPVAFNRIGTHPIENLFGYVRITSHFLHTWPKFLMSIGRAVLMDRILRANNMKPHIRREYGIAGVKVLTSEGASWKTIGLPYTGPLVRDFIDCLLGHIQFTVGPDGEQLLEDWVRAADELVDWACDHTMKLYESSSLSNQSIISRSITFSEEAKSRGRS